MNKSCLLFLIILAFLYRPVAADAEDALEQELTFNVESSYDFYGRNELAAKLTVISRTAYWYVDKAVGEMPEINSALIALSQEFEEKIYPALTQIFGKEWNPGIDKDTRITILIHPMKQGRGGYFDSADEYPKVQIPDSNEKEIVYLNSQYVTGHNAKSFLAHELMHLITFNQKDKMNNVSEDIWLNEARSEYASTLLGYDNDYKESNLQRRVKDFLNKPFDSLTEWRELPEDYGVINLFTQYLVDHYGIQILSDSLHISQTGIKSINAVLSQKGFKEDFSQVFTNWTVAILINNCQVSEKYCYFNNNLKNLKVTPLLNFIPSIGNSTLSVTNTTKDWAGNWHKFIGGNGILKIEFAAGSELIFKVPYILEGKGENYLIDFLKLDKDGRGQLELTDFGSQNIALTIIPITQNKISNFSNLERSWTFFWAASTQKDKEEVIIPLISPLSKPISQMSKEEILARISEIKALILQLQALLASLTGSRASCQDLTQNLYFGMINNDQVRCLQEFLKSQDPEIYPEGIVNGNFYTMTQEAVIRFQEKYAPEILVPVDETRGTGYVGSLTRAKINQLLTP